MGELRSFKPCGISKSFFFFLIDAVGISFCTVEMKHSFVCFFEIFFFFFCNEKHFYLSVAFNI